MRILAIDDEPLALKKLERTLLKEYPDCDFTGFENYRDLLNTLQKDPADILFLDVEMPDIKGVDLARLIVQLHPRLNIIFLTGYTQYKADAIDMFASGYIMKPVTVEKIKNQFEHLRFPILAKRFRAITFGNFVLYVDGVPVSFHRAKSAELFAFLVDRGGAIVTRPELTYALFEDETHSRQSQKNLNNVIATMCEDLEAVGAGELIYKSTEGLAVNRTMLDADVFDYLDGKNDLFFGEYMEQYEWGENFKGLHTNID